MNGRTKKLLERKEREVDKLIKAKELEYKNMRDKQFALIKRKEAELMKSKVKESLNKISEIIFKRMKNVLKAINNGYYDSQINERVTAIRSRAKGIDPYAEDYTKYDRGEFEKGKWSNQEFTIHDVNPKQQFVNMLNEPDILFSGRNRIANDEEDNNMEMADPIEIDSLPFLKIKSNIEDYKAKGKPGKRNEGRFDREKFVETFSGSFIKYHDEMLKNEYGNRDINLNEISYRSDYKNKSEGVHSIEKLKRRNLMTKTAREFFNTSKKSQRRNNRNQSFRGKSNISSYGNIGSDNEKPNEAIDFIEMNKHFVKEMSNINSEINSEYNCLMEVPRLKIPKPELVIRLTKYKMQIQKENLKNSAMEINENNYAEDNNSVNYRNE